MSRVIAIAILASISAAAHAAIEIASGVDLVPGAFVAGVQPDGNTVIFKGTKGLIVFDTGRHPEHTQAIVDFANDHHTSVAAIVNSHWHLDHVGGNVMLRKAFPDARVYASGAVEEAMHGFLANYRSQLEDAIQKAGDDTSKTAPWRAEIGLIDAGPALFPDVRIAATATHSLAGRSVRIGYEKDAVTGGDIWLFDPSTRVLASGDLVTLPAPLFDTACPEHWRDALGRLARIDYATLVPGHGAPMNREQFTTYRRAFDHLLDCAAGKSDKKVCIDGWMHDADALIPASDQKLARSLVDYYVDNSLRSDVEKTRKLCAA